jgi:nucleotide-binding universal stress UspA family protein
MKKLVTILVPTDFSKVSMVAAQYAAKLGTLLHARVILLSVIELEPDTNVLQNWKKLEAQMTRSARKNLDKLLTEVKASIKGDVDITTDLVKGVPIHEVIEEYAVSKKANLIVMGTKGATGLQKIVSGTNTATVIGNSSIPVIAIPAKATLHQLKRIVFATDLKHLESEIKILSTLANLFHAEILILHIISTKSEVRQDKKTETELVKLAQYGKIAYHQVRSNDIEGSINSFIADKHADMLTMFTHELDFFEKILGRSVTRKMAFQSRIPLLVFNRTKRK